MFLTSELWWEVLFTYVFVPSSFTFSKALLCHHLSKPYLSTLFKIEICLSSSAPCYSYFSSFASSPLHLSDVLLILFVHYLPPFTRILEGRGFCQLFLLLCSQHLRECMWCSVNTWEMCYLSAQPWGSACWRSGRLFSLWPILLSFPLTLIHFFLPLLFIP